MKNISAAGVCGFIILTLAGVVGVFMLYCLFIYTPVKMYTGAECLRKGYPKAMVSVGLERYCTNLDGSVTINVVKASN